MIPENAIARPSSCLSTPKRKVGTGAVTKVDVREIQNQEIDRMDRECWPRWKIAAVTGLSERQIYNRLNRIKADRAERRAIANAN